MNNTTQLHSFAPHPPDAAGVLSWIQIGDLHMTTAGQQNALDLQAIVAQINAAFAASISFVFLPGDNADHGNPEAYQVVRHSLDQLQLPWCAILGDHDVEQKTFHPFQSFLAEQTHYAFTAGPARFLALNAFDLPAPPSFAVLPAQLAWLEQQLQAAVAQKQVPILLLHCYPSDLKQGGQQLARLVAHYGVKLIAMGHTHYNEIAHDGRTLYTATRSTGQIEEGPAGFSITNLDGDVLSWHFLELGQLPAVIITSPSDERLLPDDATHNSTSPAPILVRVKSWSHSPIVTITATFFGEAIPLQSIPSSSVWQAAIPARHLPPGIHPLRVLAIDTEGHQAADEIRILIGARQSPRMRAGRDQDNALEAWPAHGLLSTQLGPNKNGKKW